jgi:hypothetical protein
MRKGLKEGLPVVVGGRWEVNPLTRNHSTRRHTVIFFLWSLWCQQPVLS